MDKQLIERIVDDINDGIQQEEWKNDPSALMLFDGDKLIEFAHRFLARIDAERVKEAVALASWIDDDSECLPKDAVMP